VQDHLFAQRLRSRARRTHQRKRAAVQQVDGSHETKQLGVDFSTVSATLNKIAEISSDLYNVHKKFNGTVKSHKWDRMQDVYAAINQSMVTWEKSLRKQVETMQNYMMKSFKYSLKEFESFNEVVKLRNTAGQEYFKSWVELENRKEKLFLAGEVQKWEIDFKEVKLTPDDVLKNKKVAKMLMLPQVDCFRAANDES
jgi:ribosome-associated translation inhibitor RaiA